TLTAIMRRMRSADISSTREVVPTMPALFTSAASVPNSSAASNSARMSFSSPTSHFAAIALPFFATMAETTPFAAAPLVGYPTKTRSPRGAAGSAPWRTMPRLPPVMIKTLWVNFAPDGACPRDRCPTSEGQHKPRGIFQAVLDARQEGHRVLAVDDA